MDWQEKREKLYEKLQKKKVSITDEWAKENGYDDRMAVVPWGISFDEFKKGTAKTEKGLKDGFKLDKGDAQVKAYMWANENAFNIPITNIGDDAPRGELWYILSKHPEVHVVCDESNWQNEYEMGGMVEGYTEDGETTVYFEEGEIEADYDDEEDE